MKKTTPASRIVSSVFAVLLVFGLMPTAAFAAGNAEVAASVHEPAAQRSEEEIAATVDALLAAGDYAEGEAIVCIVDSQAGGGGGLSTQSDGPADDLLAGAEGLSTVTASQYVEATGESIPASGSQSGTPGGLSVQSANDEVAISLVRAEGMDTGELLRELLRDPRVLSAEPNYIMGFENEDGSSVRPSYALSTSVETQSDSDIAAHPDMTGYQWFSGGVEGAAPQHLDETLNPGVKSPGWNDPGAINSDGVVAILDSGVDYRHPDLVNVMYHFSPELQSELGCGEFGYAPAREDKTDPMDGFYHGTHCAGIVAAEWNGSGVSGIANGVKICAVSVAQSLTNSTYCYDSIVKGYDFIIRAARAGVDIRAVNRSLSALPSNTANAAMIQAAGEAGIVTCIASGNDHLDLDGTFDDISTSQQSPYVLRVNASNLQDCRAVFSNYGLYTTDLFAPGVGILSTMPSGLPNQSHYFPQFDADPIHLETAFADAPLDVYYVQFNDETRAVEKKPCESIEQGSVGIDGDGKSLKATVTVPAQVGSTFCVDVPIGDASISKDDVQDISLALYARGIEIRATEVGILLEGTNETGGELYAHAQNPNSGPYNLSEVTPMGWTLSSLHIPDSSLLDQNIKTVTDTHGRTCVRLRFGAVFNTTTAADQTPVDIELHLDQIAIGRQGNGAFLPYGYLNGTSMATPCVTGCVAIASSRITGVDPDVRAASTVRSLKTAVRQADGYEGLCKQGGQVDLALLNAEDGLAPVIESAQVANGTITVKGSHFAQAGTLKVGGVEAQVLALSDASVTASWPQGVSSGLVPVTVKTDGGAESCRAFLLAAPETTPSAELYERDLPLLSLYDDKPSILDTPDCLAADKDGTLYVAASDNEGREYMNVRWIMSSTDRGATWKRIELPQDLKNLKLAAGDDELFVLGATPAEDPTMITNWYLYRLDLSKGTFELLHDAFDNFDESGISSTGSLAYVGGNLYFIDAFTNGEATATHMRIRIFDEYYDPIAPYVIDYDYTPYNFYFGPKVTVTGNSIYVCGLSSNVPLTEGHQHGLHRVDVAADGSLSCTDLSAALSGLPETVDADNICIAAGDQGVFLIGNGLDALLPEGAARTDTFLLEPGAAEFAPYSKTLSYAPVHAPAGVCADGWLYAYAASAYEKAPQFGRATKLEVKAEPEPAPIYTPKTGESVIKGSYTYTVTSSTTASVKLSPAGKKSLVAAKVPKSVKLGAKTFKVTAIDAEGFASAKKLTSVAIGGNVKRIGPNAFDGCAKLAKVTGGAAVTTIGAGAFADCAKLSAFSVSSKNLTTIGDAAYKNCKKLATFKATSPKLAKIGAAAYKNCPKLKTLTITGTTKLTKAGVKASLAGSSVKTVNVKNSKKAAYEKMFTVKNCGKKVTVK